MDGRRCLHSVPITLDGTPAPPDDWSFLVRDPIGQFTRGGQFWAKDEAEALTRYREHVRQ